MIAAMPRTKEKPAQVKLSPLEREHILDGEYQILRRTTDIPASVRTRFGGSGLEMAEPGEPFRATDVIVPGEKKLPFRRLIFAGCSREKCFIHYERGGRGYGCHVVVFGIDSLGAATFIWAGAGFRAAADLTELRAKIRSGDFADDRPYSW
jgi:hypothetical protein